MSDLQASKLLALLPTGWWFSALPQYRPHPEKFATYSLFSYEALPPIPEHLDGEFQWLQAQQVHEPSLATICDPLGNTYNGELALAKLAAITEQVAAQIPAPFLNFFSSPTLHQRLRSCTDCYLDIVNWVAVPTHGAEDGFLIHFLSDSQWCLHWYLYMNQDGAHFVVVSGADYGFTEGENESRTPASIDLTQEQVWRCAPSFSEFIYRFWIENEIWYSLAWDKQPLTPTQQAYVKHYENS